MLTIGIDGIGDGMTGIDMKGFEKKRKDLKKSGR